MSGRTAPLFAGCSTRCGQDGHAFCPRQARYDAPLPPSGQRPLLRAAGRRASGTEGGGRGRRGTTDAAGNGELLGSAAPARRSPDGPLGWSKPSPPTGAPGRALLYVGDAERVTEWLGVPSAETVQAIWCCFVVRPGTAEPGRWLGPVGARPPRQKRARCGDRRLQIHVAITT